MALELIDRIYECAFAPELWPAVLDDLGRICEARGGVLFAANTDTGAVSYTASETQVHCAREYERRRLHMDSVATDRLLAHGQHGFIFDHDVITQAEMEADPVFSAVLWPAGLGHTIGTSISAPTGDVLLCMVSRGREQGPANRPAFRKLNRLRPHLARSALMSARLRLERARAVVETLDLLGLPALVFDSSGRVIAANPLIEAERERLRWRARDRVALVTRWPTKCCDAPSRRLRTTSRGRRALSPFATRTPWPPWLRMSSRSGACPAISSRARSGS